MTCQGSWRRRVPVTETRPCPAVAGCGLGAIAARDYPVILGATVLYAALVIGANLVADLVLPLVDPRRRAA